MRLRGPLLLEQSRMRRVIPFISDRRVVSSLSFNIRCASSAVATDAEISGDGSPKTQAVEQRQALGIRGEIHEGLWHTHLILTCQ